MIQKAQQDMITFRDLYGHPSTYQFVGTIDCQKKRLLTGNDRYCMAQPLIGFTDTEFVTAEDQNPKQEPQPELRLAAERGLTGLVAFLMVSTGLAFVIWFLWTFVMGGVSMELYDLADVIRGYR